MKIVSTVRAVVYFGWWVARVAVPVCRTTSVRTPEEARELLRRLAREERAAQREMRVNRRMAYGE